MTSAEIHDILNYCRTNYGDNGISDEYEEEVSSRIATALQSERQRIADSLPEKKVGYNEAVGWNDCLEAVRAVLIPPTGSSPGAVDASAQGHEAITDNEEAR